jgi:phosphomannomutase
MKSYLFDVDGTITPPRESMDLDFVIHFLSWMEDKDVYLVAGSSKDYVYEQIPSSVLSRVSGIFCSMGNELWQNDALIYSNDWELPLEIKDYVYSLRRVSEYIENEFVPSVGPVIHYRTGMINFSIIGRDADSAAREAYFVWDNEHKERESLAEELEAKFPEIEVRVGGQISMDIQPKGNNKSLASKWIRENKGGEMVFFGDKCTQPGNDYDIVADLESNGDGESHQVSGPEDTKNLLV